MKIANLGYIRTFRRRTNQDVLALAHDAQIDLVLISLIHQFPYGPIHLNTTEEIKIANVNKRHFY